MPSIMLPPKIDSRHPSEYFVKYLLTLPQPEAQDDNWIRAGVNSIGYPPPSVPYISILRQVLRNDLPVDYDPFNRYNRQTTKFLRNHGVWALHNPGEDTKESTRLLNEPPIRKVVEQLLLGRLESKEIASRVNSRFKRFYTADTISDYSHYFWNCSLMKTSDWVTFFDMYDRPEQSKNLSIVNGGSGMALHIAGFKQEMESKEILRDMLEAINFDFKDWKNSPRSMERTRAYSMLAKAVKDIDERMSESSTAIRDHLALFKNWQMAHNQQTVKGIEDVAPNGNFSDSGFELKELPEKAK